MHISVSFSLYKRSEVVTLSIYFMVVAYVCTLKLYPREISSFCIAPLASCVAKPNIQIDT